ncbi:MAG: sigma-54 dependent transcriptional regulator [Proteobacteria bacterium]|nr:sigma-54 dependent transcriptional regulator [Pseudomonadota bacterium]MBU1687405.1 sigma-54 dependent transcriptional regulator [Pseudomonadota bacterium]
MKILMVDDEPMALSSLQRLLKRCGYRDVETCDQSPAALARIQSGTFDVVFLDLLMPEMDGLQVLEATKPYSPHTEFIMLTAVDDVDTAVKALRLGAYDYLVKPVDHERLILVLEHAFERRALLSGLTGASSGTSATLSEAFDPIITHCPRMKELLLFAQTMAKSGNPVLITGESGTGKELLARAIHEVGPVPGGPYVPVNVASVSESLFESHFFGHVKGAFTGATMDYPGYFEQADGGTLFLDEIGELSPLLQAKFLRVLEDGKVTRLGDPHPITVDVRIVAATNADLDKACQQGTFRLDLLYRLKSIHLHLPPLREREGDIPFLADHFLKKAALRHGKTIKGFSPEALDLLQRQSYPGNIRELAQKVETALLMTNVPYVSPEALGGKTVPGPVFGRKLCSLKEDAELQTAYVLTQTGGDRKQAAAVLGITVRQVQRKIAEMKKDSRWISLLGDI